MMDVNDTHLEAKGYDGIFTRFSMIKLTNRIKQFLCKILLQKENLHQSENILYRSSRAL